jgi:hypothetical protein
MRLRRDWRIFGGIVVWCIAFFGEWAGRWDVEGLGAGQSRGVVRGFGRVEGRCAPDMDLVRWLLVLHYASSARRVEEEEVVGLR